MKNVMLASADQVAIDAVAAKMMGFDPMSLEYIRLAHEDGLGVGDPRDIEIVGDATSRSESWGFHVGDNLARAGGGDLIWFGPLKRFQKLFFHTPLVNGVHPRRARPTTTTTAGRSRTGAPSRRGSATRPGAACSTRTSAARALGLPVHAAKMGRSLGSISRSATRHAAGEEATVAPSPPPHTSLPREGRLLVALAATEGFAIGRSLRFPRGDPAASRGNAGALTLRDAVAHVRRDLEELLAALPSAEAELFEPERHILGEIRASATGSWRGRPVTPRCDCRRDQLWAQTSLSTYA